MNDHIIRTVIINWDVPFTLHRNSPIFLESHIIEISLRWQQFMAAAASCLKFQREVLLKLTEKDGRLKYRQKNYTIDTLIEI